MIVVDFNGIAFAAMFSDKGAMLDCNEDMIRHIILNCLRSHNVKHREQYGQMYIACDSGSWRRDYFKEYKAKRRKDREENDNVDWDKLFGIIDMVRQELEQYSPYHVLKVDNCEADDIIATLVHSTQVFGCSEKVMIISNDKDFVQLQTGGNVRQYSPQQHKFVTHKNPREYLIEHVLRGDTGDGVPNVLSDDDALINDDKKQTPLRKTKIEEWKRSWGHLNDVMPRDVYRNFQRNERCIDLNMIPDDVTVRIEEAIANLPKRTNLKMLNYLVKKRCRLLIECVDEFFVK